jgi:mevalonate kinase
MRAVAPGKLILSGEHAVVYGQPAIAMAVNRYAFATVERHLSSLISFELFNLKYHKDHTLKALRAIKHQLLDNYGAFQQGQRSIKDVLKLPMELTQFAITNLLDKINHKLTDGLQLKTHSDIPMGCGMGSSAAAILVATHAMANYLQIELSDDLYLRYGLEAENLQHGQSSGLDLHVCYHGGCLQFQNHHIEPLPLPACPIYIVNTGTPQSSTGECVAHVKESLQDTTLSLFGQVTEQFRQGLLEQDSQRLMAAVKHNHQLLVSLGVVPEKIQHFITALEAAGFSAKICGAGATQGDAGGIIMILSNDDKDPSALCQSYGYQSELITCDTQGLRTAA